VTVDLRRFEYAFEPLLRQRTWRLEALEATLGRVTRQIAEAEEAEDVLRGRFGEESRAVARLSAVRLDPAGHARSVEWLGRLRREIMASERDIAALRERRAEVAAQCVAQQRLVDVIEHHREDCLTDFVREEQGRQASEADRDWLSRRRWHPADDGRGDADAPREEER
jgi:hypothetical protein